MMVNSENRKANKFNTKGNWFVIIVIVSFLLFPLVIKNDYIIDVAFFFGIYTLLGLSLNIVLGEVGLFDLGHMGFAAIGAYTTAILNTTFGIPVLVLIPVSAIAAAIFAYLVCSPIIHLKGDYLCIVTIGMGEIIRLTLLNNPFGLTGGPNGVFGICFPSIGNLLVIDSCVKFYYYIWIIIGLTVIALIRLQNSRIGRAWNYVREDVIAAEASGIDVRYYKLLAFVIGAALAGVAGNIYATKLMIVSPESFTFMESCLLFCIVLIGGMGSIPGVFIGAAAISFFPEIFQAFAQYRMLIFGAVMVIMMMFRPGGAWPRQRGKIQTESIIIRAEKSEI
ncbi:MAG: branched-chain amino acid ABC transporter permease [Atribacterota bacterium]|jgi:branched-chain amino acid transport system permease protein|nr:branched-chain amino acid ABC transporter permease [Atribacterota bacterium]MDY0382441.1 branched-chain amino acid ABC transporter permease [Atribacterota bacterium]